MLLITTNTANDLLRNVNIDDLEWPLTPKIAGFSEFFRNFALRHAFQEWIAPKWLEIDKDNLHMIFSAWNVDFCRPRLDSSDSRKPAHVGVKERYPSKKWLLLVCLACEWLQIGTAMLLIKTKHWWRASYKCQHRWPWMTLNPKNIDFKWFLTIFGCKRVNCDEMDGDRLRLPANRNCYRFRTSHEH